MLAVKQALARTDQVLTYVFDEVDAGVGGGDRRGDRAQAEAHRRRPAGHRHHPPRRRWRRSPTRTSASARASARGKTRVAIEPLSESERAAEIARMLAGAAPSPQAAAHADEMLRAARDA